MSYRSNSNLWEYKEKDRIRGPFLSVAERRFELYSNVRKSAWLTVF